MKTQTGIMHIATKETSRKKIVVEIRLDDECHNGHCDFAITGETYIKKDGRWIHNEGGCIHDTILKHFPEFRDFVTLHLSDCHGVPMYAIENGIYFLKEGGGRKGCRVSPHQQGRGHAALCGQAVLQISAFQDGNR